MPGFEILPGFKILPGFEILPGFGRFYKPRTKLNKLVSNFSFSEVLCIILDIFSLWSSSYVSPVLLNLPALFLSPSLPCPYPPLRPVLSTPHPFLPFYATSNCLFLTFMYSIYRSIYTLGRTLNIPIPF